jgi:four helix bundle protein
MYPSLFFSKLPDCDGEINETDTSLDFARDCSYISDAEHTDLVGCANEVRRMLGAMLNNPGRFLLVRTGSEGGMG